MLLPEASAGPNNEAPNLSQPEAVKLTTWRVAPPALAQGVGNRDALARHCLTVPDYRV